MMTKIRSSCLRRGLVMIALTLSSAVAFTSQSCKLAISPQHHTLRALENGDKNVATASIDVSDLGLTMADLEKTIPIHNFSIESSGYQSTSRIPDVNDDGCFWVENPEDMDVTLRIPGLRGQPAECLGVLFSTTTVSVTAFGRVVWSCIQMGISDTDDCMFLTQEGADGVPVIQLSIKKRETEERWGGFILQIGEDSIL